MFRKKSKESGKQGSSGSQKSFAYEIPEEDLDPHSDFGNPNFDNANSFNTLTRFSELLSKIKIFLLIIIGILVLTCTVMAFLLIFNTDYEIAYADDGTSLTCLVE